ncbi:opioid-binding protein/cell adhesion molecule homolog isoform X5 [Phyllopteryx taeniolatus]|uniref:opioid-binding protein/cell adhesion molecule homolog isoform X5 n=1 Tax=Phyllopteryx taeniolatus TaxID=161469 RepID=UPI002AD47E77|nr:opioid-binding protein/cell adhesion molecule homolog isoform X5 [Phyllopteryx taeniolatus]
MWGGGEVGKHFYGFLDFVQKPIRSIKMTQPIYWAMLVGMAILLMGQGLPVQTQGDSQSDKNIMDNITVRQGETVFLRCTQGEIVTHTAWLNRSSILYAGDEKWSVDPRVSLVTLNQEEFTIKIENVAMTDEGQYVCAVQTSRRPTTNVVHVHVQVPPKIINLSRDIVVNEGANVTVLCQANGKPQPSVSWKLISSSGDLATDDEYLEIPSITRHRAGTYECTAVNDIDTDTETIDITVNYAPTVSDGRDIGVTLGQRGVLECEADAVPEADFEWYKDDRRFINGFDGMEIVNTGSLSKLTFFNVSDGHYGNYTCVAINKLGSSNTSFVMYGPRAVQDGSGSTLGVQLDICLLFIVFLPFLLKF